MRLEWPIRGTSGDWVLVRSADATEGEHRAALPHGLAALRVAESLQPGGPLARHRLVELYAAASGNRFLDAARAPSRLLLEAIGSALAAGRLLAVRRRATHHGAASPHRAPAPAAYPAAPSPGRKLERVRLQSVTARSDHGLLTNWTTDWRRGGKRYCDLAHGLHWTPELSYPISQTKATRLWLRVAFEWAPLDCAPGLVEVVGKGELPFLRFSGPAQVEGKQLVATLESSEALPDGIGQVEAAIDWQVHAQGRTFEAGRSGPHVIYPVFGPAVDEKWPEDGVTHRRMARAVEWIAKTRTLSPHELAARLMHRVPGYTLTSNPAVPPQFHHPSYFNEQGGAWALSDFPQAAAECQAICRLVRGMWRQLACPGDAEVIVVWADPDVGGGKSVIERPWKEGGGLRSRTRVVRGTPWFAALLDGDPKAEGRLLEKGEIGLNSFEACFRLTADRYTRYYGGGAGVYDSAQDVLSAFYALCWLSHTTLPSGKSTFRVEEIVARYR